MKEVRNPAPLPDADGQGQHPEGGSSGIRRAAEKIHRLSPDTVIRRGVRLPIIAPGFGLSLAIINAKMVGDVRESSIQDLRTPEGEEVTLTARGERLTMTVGDNRVRGDAVDAMLDGLEVALRTGGFPIGSSDTAPDASSARADRLHALVADLPFAFEEAETTWTDTDGARHTVVSTLLKNGNTCTDFTYIKRTPQVRPVPGVSERPILVDTVEEFVYRSFSPDGFYSAAEGIPDEVIETLRGHQQEAAQRYNTEQLLQARDTNHPDRDEKKKAARQVITGQAEQLERAVSAPDLDEIEDGDTLFTGTSDAGSGGYVFPERGDDNDRTMPPKSFDERDGFTEI